MNYVCSTRTIGSLILFAKITVLVSCVSCLKILHTIQRRKTVQYQTRTESYAERTERVCIVRSTGSESIRNCRSLIIKKGCIKLLKSLGFLWYPYRARQSVHLDHIVWCFQIVFVMQLLMKLSNDKHESCPFVSILSLFALIDATLTCLTRLFHGRAAHECVQFLPPRWPFHN